MNKIKLISLLAVTAIIMTGCVDAEKNKLSNRADAYWQHKINKEFNQAYEFLSPGWKKTDSVEAYKQRMIISKANWLNSKVAKKQCSQPDLCVVIMDIVYEFKFPTAGSQKIKIESKIKETWILKDNTWFHLPLKKKMSQK